MLRARAGFLLVERCGGVAAGWAAAELLGRSCGPRNAPAEVLVPGHVRAHAGLVVHRGTAGPGEVWQDDRWAATSPLRTAWDLARRLDLVEAVLAVDALARRRRREPAPFDLGDLLRLRKARPGARGCTRVDRVLDLVDPRAESPMETRMRLLLVLAGLPVPAVQYEIRTRDGRRVRFDLAYPEARLAIEYDGDEHDDTLDRRRDVRTAQLGWHTLRLLGADILRTPQATVRLVAGLRSERARHLERDTRAAGT
ncbi:endonuclease domain-containing protein [Pseudonocardia sp. RS010]|uniref:endonuclease domain-containing protein n=1 Tax=Pseudonocardia sp. RS010 TaxID=3385979 RepID=UPI00399FCEEC